MHAFILVDLQNDFLPGGALAVEGADQIIPIANQLLHLPFSLRIALKDCHPLNHCSFATTHQKEVGDAILIAGNRQELWPNHCIEGTVGSDLSSDLDQRLLQHIVLKGTLPFIDSYSGFFDNNHEHPTRLHSLLQEKKISSLFLAGVCTDYCVRYTAEDALKLGYQVHIIADACKAASELNALPTLNTLAAHGAKIIESKDVKGLIA